MITKHIVDVRGQQVAEAPALSMAYRPVRVQEGEKAGTLPIFLQDAVRFYATAEADDATHVRAMVARMYDERAGWDRGDWDLFLDLIGHALSTTRMVTEQRHTPLLVGQLAVCMGLARG